MKDAIDNSEWEDTAMLLKQAKIEEENTIIEFADAEREMKGGK